MKKSGFTLVEMVVVAGIISLVSVIIAQVFFTTVRSNTKTEIIKDVKQNGEYAIEVITRMLQNASVYWITCDGSAQPSITLTNADSGITTFRCAKVGDVFRIASESGTGVISYVTNENVSLTSSTTECANASLAFVCSTDSALQPSTVKTSFTLSQVGSPQSIAEQAQVSFQSTATLRNKSRRGY